MTKLADILEGSTIMTIDPKSCVPIVTTRRTVPSGTERLKQSFRGVPRTGEGSDETIMTAGSDEAIVVPLQGSLRHHVLSYFKRAVDDTNGDMKSRPDEEVTRIIASREVWYGIVDGNCRHGAVLQLMKEEPDRWEAFKWSVCVVKSTCPVHRLRQLARTQYSKHEGDAWIEITFYEKLSGLYKEYLTLSTKRNKAKPTGSEVVTSYDGGNHTSKSNLYETATTVMRLPHPAIQAIGKLINEQFYIITAAKLPDGHPGHTDTEIANRFIYCPVYWKFVNLLP